MCRIGGHTKMETGIASEETLAERKTRRKSQTER
jgi:hypothetical protein